MYLKLNDSIPIPSKIWTAFFQIRCFRLLLRGSLGPSTVTLMALPYVAICGGDVLMVMVSEKLFPAIKSRRQH